MKPGRHRALVFASTASLILLLAYLIAWFGYQATNPGEDFRWQVLMYGAMHASVVALSIVGATVAFLLLHQQLPSVKAASLFGAAFAAISFFAAALAMVITGTLHQPLWGLVFLSGFPLTVYLGLLVARRRGPTTSALTPFRSRPVMAALIFTNVVLGVGSVFTYFGGPEIVAHILSNPAQAELQFEYKLCPDDHASVGSADSPAVQWEATNIARVSAIAEANCGTNWLFGNYAVSGDTITVEYQAIVSRYYLCDCAHQVSFRIRDIPKRDYTVQILARPQIYSRLWLWKLLGHPALVAQRSDDDDQTASPRDGRRHPRAHGAPGGASSRTLGVKRK
jgi:hypothetical protein